MDDSLIRLSRKELYDQVWAEPVTRLARRYGFSDVWLAKICRRCNIPRPPRGYWAKRKAGENPPKTPLPKRKEELVIEIYTRPWREKDTTQKKAVSERHPIPAIAVAEDLQDPHPFILKSADILSSRQPDPSGLLIPPGSARCLMIRVSRDSLARALRIMDALVKALGAMGFEVSMGQNATTVNIFGMSLGIGLGEELSKVHLKAKDHNLDGSYQFGYSLYEKNPVPSGKLFLAIVDGDFDSAGDSRRKWRDTELHRLEDSLKGFISGLMKAANRKKMKSDSAHGQE